MLQPGHPRPLTTREQLQPSPPVPTTSQTHAPRWHRPLSPPRLEATGMGLVGLRPPHPKKVVLGLSGWVKQLGEGLRRAEVREGMGRSPISATSAWQPGHSHDFILTFFCFLITFSTGPFRINYKSVTGRNHKPSPRGSWHGPGLTPHSPCRGTAAVLGRQAGGCGDRDKHGMSPCARPGDDTASFSHITPSPPTTGQMMNRSHLPRWIQT